MVSQQPDKYRTAKPACHFQTSTVLHHQCVAKRRLRAAGRQPVCGRGMLLPFNSPAATLTHSCRGCNFVGVCDRLAGWCRCPAGWTGDDCSTRLKVRCAAAGCPARCCCKACSMQEAAQTVCCVQKARRCADPGLQRPCSWDFRTHGFEPFNEPVDYSQPSASTSRCSQLCDEDVGGCCLRAAATACPRSSGQALRAQQLCHPAARRRHTTVPWRSLCLASAACCRAVLLQLDNGVRAHPARPLPATRSGTRRPRRGRHPSRDAAPF